MRVKIDQWEVLHAIERYIKQEYGVDYDVTEGLEDDPVIEYQETVRAFKKHKNGRVVKDSTHGFPIIDHSKTTYENRSCSWQETDSITFYLAPSTV